MCFWSSLSRLSGPGLVKLSLWMDEGGGMVAGAPVSESSKTMNPWSGHKRAGPGLTANQDGRFRLGDCVRRMKKRNVKTGGRPRSESSRSPRLSMPRCLYVWSPQLGKCVRLLNSEEPAGPPLKHLPVIRHCDVECAVRSGKWHANVAIGTTATCLYHASGHARCYLADCGQQLPTFYET